MRMTNAAATAIAAPPSAGQVRSGLSGVGRIVLVVLLLVIFEGAIRKWIAPGLTAPLILLRDLLALYVVFHALTRGGLRRSRRLSIGMLAWSCCVIGWGLLQLTLGESNFKTYVIGLRFWLLYLWFAVAAASVMSERDYLVAIRTLLITLLLMTPLAIVQHYAPPTSVLNHTPDTAPEDVFTVARGIVRTTGTFTFTAGFVFYLAMCAPFVLGLIESRKRSLRHLLYAMIAFGCMAASSLVSGSRGAVMVSAATLALYLVGNLVFAPMRKKGRAIVAALVVVLAAGATLYVLGDAVTATQERFSAASQSEDLGARILAVFLGEPWASQTAGVLGAGIGAGSNVAQFAESGSRDAFALAETETGRSLLEGGLLGWLFLILKFATVLTGSVIGLVLAVRTRSVFPVLIWTSVSIALLTWPVIGQITANGMFGLFFLLALLSVRYPRLQLFG